MGFSDFVVRAWFKRDLSTEDDFKLSVGFCGKDGQTAPVGDGGPHTRILNALVGGMG